MTHESEENIKVKASINWQQNATQNAN